MLFVRHGESEWNARGLWQGQADPPLSARGREQAHALAATLGAGRPPALLASSDLLRARETAQRLAAELGLALRVEADLRERDVGAWSGLTHEEIGHRFPDELARFRSGDPALRPGGGESRVVFAGRVERALDRLHDRAGGTLWVVSHLGVLRVLRPGVRLANAEWLELGREVRAAPAYAPSRDDAL